MVLGKTNSADIDVIEESLEITSMSSATEVSRFSEDNLEYNSDPGKRPFRLPPLRKSWGKNMKHPRRWVTQNNWVTPIHTSMKYPRRQNTGWRTLLTRDKFVKNHLPNLPYMLSNLRITKVAPFRDDPSLDALEHHENEDVEDDGQMRVPFNTPESLSSTDSSPSISPRFDFVPSFGKSYMVSASFETHISFPQRMKILNMGIWTSRERISWHLFVERN